MQKLFLKLSGFALLLTLLVTSCTEDSPIGTFTDPPSLSISGIGNDKTVAPGEAVKFTVSASQGDSPLKVLTIFEDGARIASPSTRVEINGAPASSAAVLITNAADKTGFVYDMTIIAKSSGIASYSIEIEDEDGQTDAVSFNLEVPSTSLAISLDGVSNTIEGAAPGSFLKIPVVVTRGASPLASIAVLENGTTVDKSRLEFKSTNNTFATNPLPLTGDDKTGFSEDVYVLLNSGTNVITIQVMDEAGATTSVDVTVSAGTDIDSEFTAVLVSNAAGPNEGGLDLYNGTSVPFNSSAAQIRDRGINTDLPAAQNWRQQIEPRNGAILTTPNSSQPEGFKYENVNTKEAIIAAYDANNILTSSDVVNVGDVFIVRNGDDYFLLQVEEVNVTTNDNRDFYRFNIKQALN